MAEAGGAPSGVKKYWIQLENREGGFPCAEDMFVLDAMIRAGHGPIRHGCCGGGCGVCKMRLVSGRVHAEKRMSRAHITEEEQARGLVLICCVKPLEDLVLGEAGK